MKRLLSAFFLLLAAFLGGCHKSPSGAPPVVHVAPVFTRPFEDGYKVGFDKGREASKVRAKLPSEDAVQAKAAEAVGDDPEHTEKWQRGWAEGYLDGFRDVATHQK
jgi:hypothetical protein